jgi:DnaJ-class molecular chaperone
LPCPCLLEVSRFLIWLVFLIITQGFKMLTLWSSNIPIENGTSTDDFPLKSPFLRDSWHQRLHPIDGSGRIVGREVRPCAQCAGRRNPLPELIRGACRGCNGRGKTWRLWMIFLDRFTQRWMRCFFGHWVWEDISPASNQMCQMALGGSPRKVGHVSEDLEVYVPKGSAHGETILFRGKVSDCRTSWLRNWMCFFGNPCGWMVKPCFP